MKEPKQSSFSVFGFLILLLVFCFLANISLGSVYIPLSQIITILSGGSSEKVVWENIIFNFRLPKAVTAIVVGAGLSVSGLQMQTLFRNPLAGPFVLGISSGASLGVAILVMAGFNISFMYFDLNFMGNWLIVLAATVGASLVLIFVVLISLRVKDSMALLIIGLMFGSATGALVGVLQFFSDARQIQAYLIWTFGNLGGMNWDELWVFIPAVFSGLLISFFLIKHMNALLLGENYARSMGLNMNKVRIWIILSTSLLAGTITAFCGPIAFVGIAVPHLARLLFNSADHKILLPATLLMGGILMLVCDSIAQMPGSDYTLPINAITSLLGAPLVIWLIIKKRNLRSSF
ncbi:MAG: iron ABC transporter permease [Bacteroidota bacterium]|nr:iron ABC transporter permease [Bacteroidota bacterium]